MGFHQKNRIDKSTLSFFFAIFGLLFGGIIFGNILGVTIKCIFDGFNLFGEKLCKLPYPLFFLFSIVFSLFATWKTSKELHSVCDPNKKSKNHTKRK